MRENRAVMNEWSVSMETTNVLKQNRHRSWSNLGRCSKVVQAIQSSQVFIDFCGALLQAEASWIAACTQVAETRYHYKCFLL